jgi:hypothetical protein
MPELKPYKGEFFLWQYVPSKPAALAIAALFIASTLLVVFRMVKTRTLFSIPFVLGGLRKSARCRGSLERRRSRR